MPYVAGIFDRTQTDIDNRTSKAYIDQGDWIRIYNNSLIVRNLIEPILGLSIIFETIPVPNTTDIPTILNLNKLTGNIERARIVAEAIGANKAIKYNWEAGASKDAPNYIDVNLWEKTMDVLNTAYSVSPVRFGRTGVSECGVGKTRNNQWRHYA